MRIAESLAFGLFLLVPSAAAGQEASGIEKFFRVDERVCTGAQPTRAQLAVLKDEGIRTVINLREPQEYDGAAEEAAEVRELGLTYVHIPVKTADPKEEQLEAFLRTTRDPEIFPVFIHCGSGNRVGAFWLVRRVLVDGWSVEDAEKEAEQIGLRSSNLRQFALDYIRRRGEKASVPGSPDGPRVGGLWDEPPSHLQARLSLGLADLSKAWPAVAGGTFGYSARSGDSLSLIGARFGVESAVLAKRNGLSPVARLEAGQVLEVNNRHIVPAAIEDGVLINIPQRLLFYFEQGQLISWYPVGLGRSDWRTPIGSFYVLTKETEPVWDVPVSIQEEMRREGKKVRTKFPPGPENPLGRYWLGLSGSSCGIHGTNAPASIYRFGTHGCIRLHPDDIADLFPRITIGTPVEIVYEPVLLARDEEGRVLLEVHPDVYARAGDRFRNAERLAEARGIGLATQSPLWKTTLRNRDGTAVAVACLPRQGETMQGP